MIFAAVLALLNAFTSPATPPVDSYSLGGVSYSACATEDAPGPCYWGGGENGTGDRFVVKRDGSLSYFEAV